MAVICCGVMLSVLALMKLHLMLPLVLSALYAFLSIRFEGVCILDFLRYASAFFLFKSQTYVWRPRYEEQ